MIPERVGAQYVFLHEVLPWGSRVMPLFRKCKYIHEEKDFVSCPSTVFRSCKGLFNGLPYFL